MTTENAVRRGLTRALATAGATCGLVLLATPLRAVDRVCPEFPGSRLWLVRMLGARLMVQNALVLLAPERPVVRLASAVDLLHAASMVPLVRSARYGRAARISGAVAAAYGALAPVLAPSERG